VPLRAANIMAPATLPEMVRNRRRFTQPDGSGGAGRGVMVPPEKSISEIDFLAR
jgi:hypothetical protein